MMILAVWRWGNWRNWQNYYPTMLYISSLNLLYNLLCSNFMLWEYQPVWLLDTHPHNIDLGYTFIFLPSLALLFLSNLPEKKPNLSKLAYFFMWTTLSILWELAHYSLKGIKYDHGWTIFYSYAFYWIMYPTLLLHFKKPLYAILLSIPIIIFLLWHFKVPFHLAPLKRS
ncbi:CBO0543 family protein [Metabacillus herbersteinensis]|uniref:CBO0543 family protein n=1 Tax=Metabacillus herbersteinensis TaxID=283816 RepID=A0ABV6GAY5_9BACI